MLQTTFDLSLIWIWHLKFDLVWFEQLFSTFENVWIWSEKFEFDFKHWKIINFISFWQLIYFPVPELTNFIFFLHENIFFQSFLLKSEAKYFKYLKLFDVWIWHTRIWFDLNLTFLHWTKFEIVWIWPPWIWFDLNLRKNVWSIP